MEARFSAPGADPPWGLPSLLDSGYRGIRSKSQGLKMKELLRGIRFRTVPEILQAVDRSIRTINTTGAAKGILRLPHRWLQVVHDAGDYIEGQ